ncbi:unnamed protein product [Alopecurus aequalis]
MVRRRIPKRPATLSETHSEHEESEDQEPEDEVPSELTLPVGTEAEVRNADAGFLGSFYEVTVTGHLTSRGRYRVLYTTLVADDQGPLEETAAAADVRPRPPREGRRGFAIHERVEALHNEGWWAGVVSAVRPPVAGAPMVYQVAFPTSREIMEFQGTALRPHRVFQAGRWVAAAEVGDGCPLFQEGSQVEVSGSAKSFGESWRPASVLKVIGASNFLVKYNHIENHTELATEIVDSQYIRPAHTWRKYKFSRSSRVEMLHEGSWWPGVIVEVIGSGMDKYKVKFKSHETSMDDVEFPRVRTVENTDLRPQFRWDGKTWLRRSEENSATGPMLASRKRPIYCGMTLDKEVGETSGEHCSYREKKLKNADVVSEPIPPLLFVCNESSKINRKSSSYPGETAQGNAVLAPPSLSLTAGLAHLSDSSLAQSSHIEKASSQKVVTTSAPAAPQSRRLHASMFGTFGQPRPLPPGPLLGMQSHNHQTPKEVIAAKRIEKARNNVSMSEDLSKPKNGDDNVELPYNVTDGCGMLSETNSVNSVDPTMTPKDIGGSQRALSQLGGGSAMDDRLSESLAIHHLPFGNTCPIRSRIEAMDIFSEMPQRPNMNQFKQYGTDFCEAMALGLMFSFGSMAERIDRLDVHQDDIGGLVQGKKQGLSILEENGFDVRALRSRLEALLCTT